MYSGHLISFSSTGQKEGRPFGEIRERPGITPDLYTDTLWVIVREIFFSFRGTKYFEHHHCIPMSQTMHFGF